MFHIPYPGGVNNFHISLGGPFKSFVSGNLIPSQRYITLEHSPMLCNSMRGCRVSDLKTYLGMGSWNHPTIPYSGGVHNFHISVRRSEHMLAQQCDGKLCNILLNIQSGGLTLYDHLHLCCGNRQRIVAEIRTTRINPSVSPLHIFQGQRRPVLIEVCLAIETPSIDDR